MRGPRRVGGLGASTKESRRPTVIGRADFLSVIDDMRRAVHQGRAFAAALPGLDQSPGNWLAQRIDRPDFDLERLAFGRLSFFFRRVPKTAKEAQQNDSGRTCYSPHTIPRC